MNGDMVHNMLQIPGRLYERMNITQAKGLIEAQKATLGSLGAIEDK
jgi:hypothetical protein